MQKTGSMVLTTTAGSSIIRCAVCGQTLLCNKPIEPNPASFALEGVGSVLQAIVKVKGALEAVEANKKSCGRLAAQWARMDECLRKQQQLIGQTHRAALCATEALAEETVQFVAKFTGMGYIKKTLLQLGGLSELSSHQKRPI